MQDSNSTATRRRILENVVRRLRKSANQLEQMLRSGDEVDLTRACGMLHATETHVRWAQHQDDAFS